MEEQFEIERYHESLDGLAAFFKMTTGVDSPAGLRHLMAVEETRGTRYFVARRGDEIVGMIGVWFDADGQIAGLEPPEVIDIAVSPKHRRLGVARALMNVAVQETREAGYDRLWLYTDGNSVDLLTFYRRLGYRLVAVVPGWWGEGSVKAILRLDIA
jgi:ribosomal protein S18 acetylase RimI-like enzyme